MSDMGEIRVKVKLINAADDSRAQAGEILWSQVRSVEVDAVVDTGAVRSVVPQPVLDRLQVPIRRNRETRYADGRVDRVGVTGPIIFQIGDRDTIEDALVLGDEVLIGQTTLESLDLLADCRNQRLIPAHPEGQITVIRQVTSRSTKVRLERSWGTLNNLVDTPQKSRGRLIGGLDRNLFRGPLGDWGRLSPLRPGCPKG